MAQQCALAFVALGQNAVLKLASKKEIAWKKQTKNSGSSKQIASKGGDIRSPT
jgi:hypothetical protein